MSKETTVTIERTSKRFKLRLLIYGLGFFVGLFWFIYAMTNRHPVTNEQIAIWKPVTLLVVSGILYLITKVRIWWNHG